LALLLILGAAQAGYAAGPEIVLGEIDPLTGSLAKHGLEIHQGILLAVAEVNDQGGLGGRPVKLLSRDDQSRPEIAVNQAQDLINREKVVGLVGGYVDTLVGPVSEVAAKYRVPFVASASLQQALTKKRHNPYFFRVSNLEGILTPLCSFLADELKPTRAAIIYMATPGSLEFAEGLKACLAPRGIQVPVMEKFRPGAPDFSMALVKVRMTGADVLLSGGFYPDNLILARQVKEKRLSLKGLVAPWGVAYPSFIAELGELSEGLLGTCVWSPGVTHPGTEQASTRFVQAFEKRFGQLPSTTTMHGYASAKVLLTALARVLEKHPQPTGELVVQELKSLDLVLPLGRVRFDAHGDPLEYRHVVVQIQEGRLVPVYPPDRATGSLRLPPGQ
jgi:branched-chain amino acid transport system substrate-binding protein